MAFDATGILSQSNLLYNEEKLKKYRNYHLLNFLGIHAISPCLSWAVGPRNKMKNNFFENANENFYACIYIFFSN